MTPLSRRQFLHRSAWAGAALLAPRSWAAVPGANSDIRMAVVGLGCGPLNRGEVHLAAYQKIPGVRVAALCDVDTAVLDRVEAKLKAKGHPVPPRFVDVRELLARSDIDAISIATPNHWHSLLGAWACAAGKDVYVEKPVSHNLWEGRQLVRMAQKTGRIVQAGTQSRSDPALQEAVAWVRAGNLGKIKQVHGLCYRRRKSIGLTRGPQPVPATVNFDLWCGPAPTDSPRRKQFHYDWHWFWPTGNGDIANDGAHRMDIARWFLGEPALAPHALSVGGRLGYVDDGQTANTQIVIHHYPTAPLVFEVRGLPSRAGTEEMDRYRGQSIGVVVDCEGGSVVTGKSIEAFDPAGKSLRKFTGEKESSFLQQHFVNFIAAVRSRRAQDLRGPIQEGHISTGLCHVANLSHRLGAQASPDMIRERVQGEPGLGEAFGRMTEHLARNGVDLRATPLTLGVPLEWDAATERFPRNAAANALCTRDYRPPYVFLSLI